MWALINYLISAVDDKLSAVDVSIAKLFISRCGHPGCALTNYTMNTDKIMQNYHLDITGEPKDPIVKLFITNIKVNSRIRKFTFIAISI